MLVGEDQALLIIGFLSYFLEISQKCENTWINKINTQINSARKETTSTSKKERKKGERKQRGGNKEDSVAVERTFASNSPLSGSEFVCALKWSSPDYHNGGEVAGISLYQLLEGAVKM